MEGPAAIKQAILREEFQRAGRTAKPADVESAFRRWIANREIAANFRRIAEAGARVEYVAADVRDAGAVAHVVADIRQRLGPIRGLIHAAGVIEDRRIVDKTPAQFDAVFDTKVAGLRNLLDAIPSDELRQIVLFSSVSARFGNLGQVDYAMANEVLNKAAQRLARQRPHCRVVSLNWGPWDGGMVGPALRREFERRGVGLIPLADGARAMVAEMANAAPDEIEVVLGSGFEAGGHGSVEPMPVTRIEAVPAVTQKAPLSTVFRRELDVASHSFLSAHQLNRKPILPVAMIIEWLAHAALRSPRADAVRRRQFSTAARPDTRIRVTQHHLLCRQGPARGDDLPCPRRIAKRRRGDAPRTSDRSTRWHATRGRSVRNARRTVGA